MRVENSVMWRLVFSIKEFCHYLLADRFNFYVEHQALLYIVNKSYETGRIVWWFLLLQEFDFKVIVWNETKHQRLDHLSWIESGEPPLGVNDDLSDAQLFHIEIILDEVII